MKSNDFKKVVSEFSASFMLGLFGLGSIVPFVMLDKISNLFEFSVVFAIIIAVVIIIFNPISGAQFNPGVTLAFTLLRGHPVHLLVPFWVAQILGWGLGTAAIFGIYGNVFEDWIVATGGNPSTMFFCTSPQPNLLAAFIIEFLMTALLLIAIFAMIDERIVNRPSPAFFPWAVGLVIVFILCFGGFTAAGINAARDLGPRLASLIYSLAKGLDTTGIFSTGQWLLYIIAPTTGAVFGGWIYDKLVGNYLLKEETTQELKAEATVKAD